MAQQRGSMVQVIIDTETTYKTTPTTSTGVILPFMTESLALKRPLTASNTLRGRRDPAMPLAGNMDVSGDIQVELSPQMGRLLHYAFGGYAVAGSAAPYTHTFKIGDLPSFCMEKKFGDLATPQYALYNGCKINSFKLASLTPGKAVDATFSVIGARETIGTTSFDATPISLGHTPFVGFNADVKQGGVVMANCTSVSVDLENQLDNSQYVLDGTGERAALADGLVKCSGQVQCFFSDIVLLNLAKANTPSTLTIDLIRGAGTGATAGNEKLTFTFEELLFSPASPVVKGPKGMTVDLTFEGYYNSGATGSAFYATMLSPVASF